MAGPSKKPEEELERVQKLFEKSEDYSRFKLHTVAGYRNKSDRFQGGDFLLVTRVEERAKGQAVMVKVVTVRNHLGLDQLIERLKKEYDPSNNQVISWR